MPFHFISLSRKLQSRQHHLCPGLVHCHHADGEGDGEEQEKNERVEWPVSPPYAGICLAYFASGFNTGAVDHEADGSTNSGIFQINSRKWCKNLNPNVPNLCQMYCSDLLNPNLKDTVICAMKITQDPQGLGSWEAWRHHCQGKDLSDWVDGCEL
ncbi:hypothetical protein MG293_016074 [Ovis ammon polii]|uniref:Sperm acrosome membrane-associated protein 3 n=1 Tax=Ovis ammon polii TaxID=230172 RepID=A0AAD4TVH9_OVIAM|nr:hypothetical protein MG293_016074 [Ovis ammon polii]